MTLRLLPWAALPVLLTGCMAGGGEMFEPDTPSAQAPQQPGEWTEISPGGETMCARGAPYSFFVKAGTSNRLVIDFMGGGACWSEQTCAENEFELSDDVEGTRKALQTGFSKGIYDRTNPENPFAEDTHVLVPYCTADVHWGDATVTYGGDETPAFTIHHRGAVNARAVLDWVFASYPRPSRLFITGSSAGAYGSLLWSAHVMKHYPGVPALQLADSGTGVLSDTFFHESFPAWRAELAFPAFIPALDPLTVNVRDLDLADLYAGVAQHFPDSRFAQYSTMTDASQLRHFNRMGGAGTDAWQKKMVSVTHAIDDRTANFAYYHAPGSDHCVTPSDAFYNQRVADVRVVDWVRGLLGRESVASVRTELSAAILRQQVTGDPRNFSALR